jgi:hypothetical protein
MYFGISEDISPEKLNGIPMTEYAVLRSELNQTFSKKNTFLNEVAITQDVTITGLFSGLDFSNPNFLLAQGNQTFYGWLMLRLSVACTNGYFPP